MANARHSKAGRFVQQRLFAGLSTFAELERRIADLPDEKSRGDAFEVFAEAYLATQRKHDAETVWPLPSVPTEILGKLQLATQDYGVDGVLKTRLGKFSAYQVKFRTGRPALTWRELSTFMGLADSPNIHSRILLTNCDELPSVLNDRQGFFCIRGSDLDRLEADDFRVIEAWLADSPYTRAQENHRSHTRPKPWTPCFPRFKGMTAFPPSWPAARAKRLRLHFGVGERPREPTPHQHAGTRRRKPRHSGFSSCCPRSRCSARPCTNGCAKPTCPASPTSASAPTRP